MGQQDPELLAAPSGADLDGGMPEDGRTVPKLREEVVWKAMHVKRIVSKINLQSFSRHQIAPIPLIETVSSVESNNTPDVPSGVHVFVSLCYLVERVSCGDELIELQFPVPVHLCLPEDVRARIRCTEERTLYSLLEECQLSERNRDADVRHPSRAPSRPPSPPCG